MRKEDFWQRILSKIENPKRLELNEEEKRELIKLIKRKQKEQNELLENGILWGKLPGC